MAEVNKDFWNGKMVLVTGAAGFIGSHLCEKLVQSGCRVRAFIRYNSKNSTGLIESIPRDIREAIEIVDGDLMDENSVLNAMMNIDTIFHMAALPSIPYSFKNPRHIFLVNTYGTFNVLSAARTAGINRIVIASSAGASEKRPILSPYIMSKAAMEKVGLGFHEGLGLKVSILRLMNNYGPRQSARAVIPAIICQALVKNDVHLGVLEPKMDFNYVKDTLNALLKTAEIAESQGKVLTWGTGISTSIGDLAQLIFSHIGRKELHVVTAKERIRPYLGPMASLEEEILATHKILDYSPKYDLQKGLKETIEWISENINQYKTEEYVI